MDNRRFNLKRSFVSRKDYAYHKTYKFGIIDFETELLFLSKMLQQDAEDCTAFASCAIRGSVKKKDYDPIQYWKDECAFDGAPITQSGTELRTPMEVGVKTGWCLEGQNDHIDRASAYFVVEKADGMDMFDSIRAAIKNNQSPVLAGVIWYRDWDISYDVNKSGNGIVPASYNNVLGGHATKIAGWKTINGEPYLVVQNSWGNQLGDNGLFYFSREISNKVFGTDGWTFIWSDTTDIQIKKLGLLEALLQNLVNLLSILIHNIKVGMSKK